MVLSSLEPQVDGRLSLDLLTLKPGLGRPPRSLCHPGSTHHPSDAGSEECIYPTTSVLDNIATQLLSVIPALGVFFLSKGPLSGAPVPPQSCQPPNSA